MEQFISLIFIFKKSAERERERERESQYRMRELKVSLNPKIWLIKKWRFFINASNIHHHISLVLLNSILTWPLNTYMRINLEHLFSMGNNFTCTKFNYFQAKSWKDIGQTTFERRQAVWPWFLTMWTEHQ